MLPILCTISSQKVSFLKSIFPLLNNGGCIYIGDVAFDSRTELENSKTLIGNEWDDEEIFFVVDEITKCSNIKFKDLFCAGLNFKNK